MVREIGNGFGQDHRSLKVTRDKVDVYDTPNVHNRVRNLLGLLTHYEPGRFDCRIRVINVTNPQRWFSELSPRLTPMPGGKGSIESWMIEPRDAYRLIDLFADGLGGQIVAEKMFEAANGQEVVVQFPLDVEPPTSSRSARGRTDGNGLVIEFTRSLLATLPVSISRPRLIIARICRQDID